MATLLNDIAYAFRQMRRNAAFTFFVVATLAIGIGGNVTIFSAVHALLFRPLPYDGAERLVQLSGRYEGRGDNWSVSLPNARDWRALNRSFDDVAYFTGTSFSIAGDGVPERVVGFRASHNLLPLLGAQPMLGRTFSASEDVPDGERVALLSYGLWQRRYGGDRDVIGESVSLSGLSYTIIGVMPRGFSFPATNAEIWVPVRADETTWSRASGGLQVVGRLRTGVSIEQARADMDAVAATLAAEYPDTNGNLSAAVRPYREAMYGSMNVRAFLFTLLGAVGLVLLIACVNVANLLLARASSREREVGVRAALGARRSRLLRQFLTEGLMLALLGGAGGVLLALWGTDLIASVIPAESGVTRDFRVDGAALIFATLATLLTGVLFGVAPALQASRANLTAMFGSRPTAAGSRQTRHRDALVVAEVALAAVLLVTAGLMLRSMLGLLAVEPGFDERNALTMRMVLDANYDGDATLDFQRQVLERLGALPGVEAVGGVDFMPMQGTSNFNDFYLEGVDGNRNAGNVVVTPGYFAAMGIPLLQGRDFEERDIRTADGVAIVSRAFADQVWPGEDAIGKRLAMGFEFGDTPYWRTVVGVTGSVRHGGLDSQARPEIYVPFAQVPWNARSITFVMRTSGDPLLLANAARSEIWSVDANQPIFDVRTLHRVVRDSGGVMLARIAAGALIIFGGVALLLAALGLYGVISYNVAQRTYEFGVRAALGAERNDLLRLVVRHGVLLVAGGLTVGFVAALAVGRVVQSMLFGVQATDPVTFAGAAAVLFTVAIAALVIPAVRASRISPTLALRSD